MQREPLHQAKHYIKQKRQHRAWNRIVAVLMCVVVFVTTYMLILPAITMEQTAYCGFEEHKHSAACFEKRLVCELEEDTPHIHSEECFQEQQILVCNVEENIGHTHDEKCIQIEQVLICTEDHEHADSCYKSEVSYVCGMTEGENAHAHSSACYETREVSVCGQEKGGNGHVHTDACYQDYLICQKEEHEHTLACFSNPKADIETKAVWEKTMSNVSLTGVWADDIISIAKSQLGYKESTKNYIVADNGHMKGYTRYGEWYGDAYGDWCAMFASFCISYAGVEDFPLDANCVNWIKQLEDPQYDSYFRRDTYYPRPGDLIFFNIDSDGGADHVGIVAEVIEKTDTEPAKVKTIEGNSENRVQYVTYEMNNPIILGYGKLPENPNTANAEEQFVLAAVTSDGQSLTLTGPITSLPFPAEEVSITAEAIVNEGAAALVSEAVADTELENGQMYLFDIRLWHNGEEIEPIGPVSLSIGGAAATGEEQNAKVFHVDEESGQATDMNAEVQEDGEIVFDTDHFSLYSLVLPATVYGKPSEVASSYALTNDLVEAPDYIGSIPSVNTAWQITEGQYSGRSRDDKTGFDGDSDGEMDVYLQKNVVPTETENEFLVYLSMDKKMTMEQFLHESIIVITTSRSYHTVPVGTIYSDIRGKSTNLLQHNEQGTYTNRYYVKINIYQDQSSSEPIYTYYDWRYGDTPNCSNGTVFLNAPGLGYIVAQQSVNYQYTGGGTGNPFTLNLYLDRLNTDFALYNTVFDNVEDQLGDYISFVEFVNSDGSATFDETTRIITWTPVDNESVISSIEAGPPVSGWENNISQLVYRVRLNVEQDGFNSCADTLFSTEASIDAGQSYEVNNYATLHYHKEPLEGAVGTESGTMTAPYPVPEVRGLLYNITFEKENDSGSSLGGAVFGLFQSDGTTPVLNDSGEAYTITTVAGETSKFRNLPWGTYILKELSPPPHYSAPTTSTWTIPLCYTTSQSDLAADTEPTSSDTHNLRYTGFDTDGKWVIQNIRGDITYEVRVVKTDETGSVLFADIPFSITDPNQATDTITAQTDDSGQITFSATFHPNVEYVLTELNAPDGYLLLPSSIRFVLKDDKSTDTQMVELVNADALNDLVTLSASEEAGTIVLTITVKNQAGYTLPETGGSGTFLFTLCGFGLIAGPLMYRYYARRRRERRIRN